MQTDGRTLRQHGTLRLVALRASPTEERYVLTQDGRVIAGGFPSLAAAAAYFERLQGETLDQATPGQAAPPPPAGPPPGPADGVSDAEPGDAANVVSLEAYRRRRR
jgi:hypothetical protein